jgi:hypothetical protein
MREMRLAFVVGRALLPALAELGARRYLLMARAAARYPGIVRRASAQRPDAGVRAYVRALAPFVTLAHELTRLLGDERGTALALRATESAAVALQRSLYRRMRAPSLSTLTEVHARNRTVGLYRYIEYAGITRTAGAYDFRVTRCRFHEAFTLMGTPWLTQAFCRSDEVVFNQLATTIRFRRLPVLPDTIGRGGDSCSFHFDEERHA